MSSERRLLASLGALQGLVLWLLADHWPEALAPAARVASVSFVCASALVLHFAWTGTDRARLLWLALGVGMIYGAVSFWVGWQLPRPGESFYGDESRWPTWMLGAGLSLFALGPFLQVYQRARVLHFPYVELFSNSWSNLFVAAIAAMFLGALWAILALWGALFALVKIELFQDLFSRPAFAWAVSGAAAALGVRLARENARVIELLRRITLLMHHLLLPLVSFVAVLFVGSLAFTGLAPLWEQEYASGLVLGWMALHVLFLNAAFQDGGEPPPESRVLRGLASAGVLTLPVYGAIAVYGLSLRIEQRGLSPLRFWGALLAVVAVCVGLGYAVSVLRRRRGWLHTLPAVNRGLACAAVALALATHTPLLDPLRWSARDQLRRMLEGRVSASEFDFGFLRFELGRAGERALSELEQHAELAGLRDGVARARAATSHGDWQQRLAGLRPEDVFVREADGALPPALLDVIRAGATSYWSERCRVKDACSAVRVELDAEPGAEWIVLFDSGSYLIINLFGEDAGAWKLRGSLEATGAPAAAAGAALRAGRFESVAPFWHDVLIDGARYRLDEAS